MLKPAMRCTAGVVGQDRMEMQLRRRVTNPHRSRTALERLATGGESPVSETVADSLDAVPKYRGTREILWESGRTTS